MDQRYLPCLWIMIPVVKQSIIIRGFKTRPPCCSVGQSPAVGFGRLNRENTKQCFCNIRSAWCQEINMTVNQLVGGKIQENTD